jgi:hypothetical protein
MRRLLALVVSVLAASRAAYGQTVKTSVDIGAIALRYGDTVSAGGISLSPTFSVAAGRTSLDAGGIFSKFGSGVSAQGLLALSTFTPSVRRFAGELAGSAGGSGHQDGEKTGQARALGRLHYLADAGGAWGGGGFGAMWDGVRWHDTRELELGMWRAWPTVRLLGSATPTSVDDTIRYMDLQAIATWTAGRAEIGLSGGVRSGSRLPSTAGQSTAWGGITVVAPMSPRASAVVAAGSYPLDFTQGYPAGRYVSAGIRLAVGGNVASPGVRALASSGVTRFDVRRLSEASIAIEVRAPQAQSVEIMGDLTLWDAERMTSLGNGRFAIVLPVTGTTSQINLRVNGGPWTVPPGLTVVKDELGTEVGILVFPDR